MSDNSGIDIDYDRGPLSRAEVANDVLRRFRAETIRHAVWTVVANVAAITLILVACHTVTGTWAPPWWAALMVGVAIPDPARATKVLLDIARHRRVFWTDICDGSTVSGCGCHDALDEDDVTEEVRG